LVKNNQFFSIEFPKYIFFIKNNQFFLWKFLNVFKIIKYFLSVGILFWTGISSAYVTFHSQYGCGNIFFVFRECVRILPIVVWLHTLKRRRNFWKAFFAYYLYIITEKFLNQFSPDFPFIGVRGKGVRGSKKEGRNIWIYIDT
jgi:hypothetical protein